ncbi:tetratricopeptide repeat protein, partial [Levilinea saccharolytica]
MPSPEETMFNEAVTALKKGDKARARDLLTRLIKRVPTQPDIWLWMSAAVETRRERVYCLKEALRLDPTNRTARHGLILAGELPPDPTLAIPPELQRRNWESQLAALQVQPERELLGLSWKQIALYAAAAVVVIALVTVGILGLRQRSTQRVFIPSSVPTYGPT